MMSKVFTVLAVIAIGSFASVLKFKDAGSDDCTISNVGGTLQAGCGSDTPQNILQADLSGIEGRLDFLENNVESIFQHLPCSPGEYRATANPFVDENDAHTAVCISCAGNTYTDEFNMKPSCTACPTGYAHDDAHDHSYCDVCATGYGVSTGAQAFNSEHGFCTACTINMFSGDNSQGACAGCTANTHTNGEHTQAACTMCDAGYGRTGYDAAGHAVCTACVVNESYSTATMITCDAIPTCGVGEGLIGGTTFSTTVAPSNYCTSCDANHLYSDEDSLSSCETHEACPAGQGVVSIADLSDTSHRNCETCSATKYSATNAFAQCYTKSSKYSKTNSATAPLQCAASYYRSGTIEYATATGALSNDVCNGCSTCPSTPTMTACSATADAACCPSTAKPAYSSFTANANTLSTNCAFTCDDSNASGANCDCNANYQRLAGSSTCTAVPTGPVLVMSNQYCNQLATSERMAAGNIMATCANKARGRFEPHFMIYNPWWAGSRPYCYTCAQSWSINANGWNPHSNTNTYLTKSQCYTPACL